MTRRTARPLAMLALLFVTPLADAAELGRYIVIYEDAYTARSAAASAGLDVHLEIPEINAVAVSMNPDDARALAHAPGVAYVEPDPPRYLQAQSVPYGIDLVAASSVAPGPDPITVCVIDTGFDLGHPDLPKARLVDGFPADWSEDVCGHGTHVAGTIAALDNRKGVVGTFPGISLYIVRVFEDCGATAASEIIAAAFRCRDAGAKVINMSLGCTGKECRSNAERAAFDQIFDSGVLNVAAGGNDGNKKLAYPASYRGVVSVGALGSTKSHAPFSQRNKEIELAAPGVGVLSTTPRRMGYNVEVKVGNTSYDGIPMLGSPSRKGRGPLVDCGLGDATCPGGGGQICLIERGGFTFASKVLACEEGGGRGAIIYNNVPGPILGSLGETETRIPSVGIPRADGLRLLDELGRRASVKTKDRGHYAHRFGTSMASPHVAGVAALIWSYNEDWTPDQIRRALQAGAEDLGSRGRDTMFGFGMVHAPASLKALLDGLP